jgi:hypothetical protein
MSLKKESTEEIIDDLELKTYFLSLPTDVKLSIMKSAKDKGKIGEFLAFLKIVLDSPISDGGISSDVIQKHFPS